MNFNMVLLSPAFSSILVEFSNLLRKHLVHHPVPVNSPVNPRFGRANTTSRACSRSVQAAGWSTSAVCCSLRWSASAGIWSMSQVPSMFRSVPAGSWWQPPGIWLWLGGEWQGWVRSCQGWIRTGWRTSNFKLIKILWVSPQERQRCWLLCVPVCSHTTRPVIPAMAQLWLRALADTIPATAWWEHVSCRSWQVL